MKKSKIFFFGVLFLFNLAIVFFSKLTLTIQQILTIHIFLFALFFLTEFLQKKFLYHHEAHPTLLLGINLLRLFICTIFLLPSILSYEKTGSNYIYNFFILYFFILFFDIFKWYRK